MAKFILAGREPELQDVMHDPITVKLMESDGVRPQDLLSLAQKVCTERDEKKHSR